MPSTVVRPRVLSARPLRPIHPGVVAVLLLPVLAAIGGCAFMISSDGRILPLSQLNSTSNTSEDCKAEGEPADAILKQMFDNLNAYRVQSGLTPLRYSKSLEAAANLHAEDMPMRRFFDHVNPDGDGPMERVLAQGFCTTAVGENIAMTPASDTLQVQLLWQSSPGHDANMRGQAWAYVAMGHSQVPVGPGQGIAGLTQDQLVGLLLDPNAGLPPSTKQPPDSGPLPGTNYWVQEFGGP